MSYKTETSKNKHPTAKPHRTVISWKMDDVSAETPDPYPGTPFVKMARSQWEPQVGSNSNLAYQVTGAPLYPGK
jgi:hypothetical protein